MLGRFDVASVDIEIVIPLDRGSVKLRTICKNLDD